MQPKIGNLKKFYIGLGHCPSCRPIVSLQAGVNRGNSTGCLEQGHFSSPALPAICD